MADKQLYALQRKNGSFVRISDFWDLENGLYQFDGILIDDDVDNLVAIGREMVNEPDQNLMVTGIGAINVVNVVGRVKDLQKDAG